MVLHRQVAVHALGRDISDLGQLGDLLDSIYEREYKFPGSYMCRALGGLDTAIWDLHGKLRGKSVCELLGGTPRPIRVYASSMKRDITLQSEAQRFLQLRDKYGSNALKLRVRAVGGRNRDECRSHTQEIIPAIRTDMVATAEMLVQG